MRCQAGSSTGSWAGPLGRAGAAGRRLVPRRASNERARPQTLSALGRGQPPLLLFFFTLFPDRIWLRWELRQIEHANQLGPGGDQERSVRRRPSCTRKKEIQSENFNSRFPPNLSDLTTCLYDEQSADQSHFQSENCFREKNNPQINRKHSR
jgi:hypothetical protein